MYDWIVFFFKLISSSFMDSSLYNINQLFTKEHCTFNPSPLAPQTTQQQQQQLGIYQEEESVDFSALVEACEKTTPFDVPSSGNTSSDPLSSSSFFPEASGDSAFPFDNLMPSLNVYNGDSNGFQSPHAQSLAGDFPPQPTPTITLSTPNIHHVSSSMIGTTTPITKSGKPGKTTKKGGLDKDTIDYREKRDRNNVAVRKSRIKSKQRVYETEKRVKDLEDENGQLQNKIALLTKELNVLKSLFASAGVSHSAIKMEVDAALSTQASD